MIKLVRRNQVRLVVKFRKSIPFSAILISFSLVGRVLAADVDIVCNEPSSTNECEITSASDRLFDVSNLAPGQTILKSIQVINEDNNDNCDLKMSSDNVTTSPTGFAKMMLTVIKGNGHLLLGDEDVDGNATSTNSLQDIFDASHVNFGEVTKQGGTVIYDWVVTFDKNAGNEYQGSNVSFDFSINFVCDHDSSSSDEETGGTVAGVTAPILAFFSGGTAFEPEVAGESTTSVVGVTTGTEKEGGTQGSAVEGIQKCRDSFLIWLLFILQLIVSFIISKKIVGVKRKLLYILLSIIILPLVFYLYLCEKRYVLISLAISLFGLFLNKYFNVK